jgi:hypothetical protein
MGKEWGVGSCLALRWAARLLDGVLVVMQWILLCRSDKAPFSSASCVPPTLSAASCASARAVPLGPAWQSPSAACWRHGRRGRTTGGAEARGRDLRVTGRRRKEYPVDGGITSVVILIWSLGGSFYSLKPIRPLLSINC